MVIKSRRMRWARHMARMEKIKECGVSVERSDGMRLLGRPRCGW
jgi:hypothetical protein